MVEHVEDQVVRLSTEPDPAPPVVVSRVAEGQTYRVAQGTQVHVGGVTFGPGDTFGIVATNPDQRAEMVRALASGWAEVIAEAEPDKKPSRRASR